MNSLLIILAVCTAPTNCIATVPMAATVFEYPRLVDCVRDKAKVPQAFAPVCTGQPFDPRQLTLG